MLDELAAERSKSLEKETTGLEKQAGELGHQIAELRAAPSTGSQ
jgi:hypothetical protein